MKIILFLFLTAFNQHQDPMQNMSTDWSSLQKQKAGTAKDIDYLSQVEKEAIMYINLARLYPKEFVRIELQNKNKNNYTEDSEYKTSLIEHLNKMEAVSELVFDNKLYENVKCFAKELGESGTTGHTRKQCPPFISSECCYYGGGNGKKIALAWLIDEGVPSLGHRINCLNKKYVKIGLSTHSHKTWGNCAVANMSY